MRLIYRGLKKEVPGAEVSAPSIVRSAQPGIVGTWRSMSSRAALGRVMSALTIAMACTFGLSLMTGCTSDDFDPTDSQQPTDSSLTYYDLPGYLTVSLDLGKIESTRADWTPDDNKLVDGDKDEYALAPGDYHFLLLYKENSSKPLVAPLTIGEISEDNSKNITVTVKSVGALGKNDLPANINTKEQFANYIKDYTPYVLLNIDLSNQNFTINGSSSSATTNADILGDITQENLLKKCLIGKYSITVNGTQYHTMTTSTYVDGSTVKYGAQMSASANKIYDNMAAAMNGTATVTAWLERLASKYTVSYTALGLNPSKIKEEAFTLEFYKELDMSKSNQGYEIKRDSKKVSYKVLGYGVDGLEPTSMFFKSVDIKNYFTNWTKADYMRCYWSKDSHYTINNSNRTGYPHQFRQGLETDTVRAYHKVGEYLSSGDINTKKYGENYFLNYVSFEDLTGGSDSPGNYPDKFFSHENTYWDEGLAPAQWMWKYGYYSAGTFLVFACQLIVDGTAIDLYRDQNEYYYTSESQLLGAKLDIMNKVILPGGNSGLRILRANWAAHEKEKSDENSSTADDLYIQAWNTGSVLWVSIGGSEREATARDLTLIPAELSGGDGQNLIAPRYSDEDATYYLAPKKEDGTRNDGTYEVGTDSSGRPITANYSVQINYNHLVSLFHKIIGPIDHFYKGYMYYAAPIPHSVDKITNNSWKTESHIGVVRNNWYNITVEGITSVGRSVDDPTQPIIPMLDVKRDYLNLNVVVIPMHSLHQYVPMSPSLQ